MDTNNYYYEPEKTKSRLGAGILIGIILGILVTMSAAAILIGSYIKRTGGYLVIGKKDTEEEYSSTVLDKETIDKIDLLNGYIDLYYNGEYDVDKMKESILSGMVNGLGDIYSVYYTPDQYAELQESMSGSYYGIGAGLSQDIQTKIVTITKIYKGTPSEEAGMRAGDVILSADGIDATSMELSDFVTKIRGEEGTKVHIELYRESTRETIGVDVERRNIQLPSIEGEVLDNSIGYIQVSEFKTNTDEQFEECLKELKAEGITGLIIDLRNNPGGLLDSVVNMLDVILPKGKIVYTEDKYGQQRIYDSDASCETLPLVVLINEHSASASEIFAGAIKDYNYGTLVGMNTFGKGIVQNVVPLKDGSALKLTTAKYFTPNGNYIHEVGIAPDVELEYEYSGPIDESYDMKYDNQLQKAIEIMNEKMQNTK